MSAIVEGRWTARAEGPFVVFIIGMRINSLWRVHRWLPLVRAMGRMLTELHQRPELGFMGGKTWFGRTIVLIQYWHSFEALGSYAKAKDKAHLPAWADFNRKAGKSRHVGVYHETYTIDPGQYENVFVNMPPTLSGAVMQLEPAEGPLAGAKGRIAA